ncbi:acyl carrier protein [Xenorhabdus sp. XENO-7]|uniref:Acyl carrier protein n=1 Tax=Xenorhabdus aichiensis TaxID=3025874 RepID=A0ABT5LZF2_9GAMM|nr:acyl carrier protein [Xenorhabdus aichiensis]MDC9620806.1 acyl carrier protein [Xenorhabdus aichiensis]
MYISVIEKIFKDVMYISEDTKIDVNKSLFLDYDMTSIDFIDFSFELKKNLNIDITPDTLWPINKMATLEENYSFKDKKWTPEGISRLNRQLKFSDKTVTNDSEIEFKELYKYFTIYYINQKLIHSLQNSE